MSIIFHGRTNILLTTLAGKITLTQLRSHWKKWKDQLGSPTYLVGRMRRQCAQKGVSNTCRVGGIWRWCSVQARRIQTAATCTGEAGGSASHFSLFNLATFNNCRGLLVPSQLLESSLKTWRTQKPKKNRLDLLSLLLDWRHLPSLIYNIWVSNYTFCQVTYRLVSTQYFTSQSF